MKNREKARGMLLAALCLCMSLFPGAVASASEEVPAFSAEGWIQDGAGLLTEEEEEKLEEKCGEILSEYGISVLIVTTNSFDG